MEKDTTRRGLLAAVLGAGAGGTALYASDILDSFAPLSGRAWRGSRGSVPDTVSSPYGDATVTYDDYHVPHIEANDEEAAYYAVGFVQAADRLFEMDLVRRLMDGRLSEALGDVTLESDIFHTKMDFRGAAEASREELSGSRMETLAQAYADGVNEYIETGPEPLEFGLGDYEADDWTVTDTLLIGAQISWGLTGSFNDLRRAVLREELGDDYERLYGRRFDHGAPIIREREAAAGTTEGVEETGTVETAASSDSLRNVDPELVDWLADHEPPELWGSNHWAVGPEHTESGSPILAYDPHLSLTIPPVWYEQRISVEDEEADVDVDIRGVTFPGIPFVIAGENRHGAWGFTNSGADVVDFYTYETRGLEGDESGDGDGAQYRYDGEWRDFETETRTIEVADGEDREIEVRKTVHGVLIEREVATEELDTDTNTSHVGVAWTGMTGTRESEAVYEFSRATDMDDYLDALRSMDLPTQNALYVDDSGNVLYKLTGRIPIRSDDEGELITGDRVFDGSAGEAEWDGFEPFGESSWDGFVPFEEKPGVVNPDYVGTANQRLVDDPTYPIGHEYASGFRGIRIYERLDERTEEGEPVDSDFMASVQSDTVDVRARILVPALLEARDEMPDSAEPWLDAMEDWDYTMDRDSEAALAFHFFYDHFREATWSDDFEEIGLDGESWWPQEWVLVTLPPDDDFFDGDRASVMADAMEAAVEEIEENGWEVYGDYNVTSIDHRFGEQVSALNYPRYPTDGTAFTVRNFHDGASAGSSWRQISSMDEETNSLSVIPGGQDGSYFSENYQDQLRMWADDEHKEMSFETPDDGDVIQFRGDSDE